MYLCGTLALSTAGIKMWLRINRWQRERKRAIVTLLVANRGNNYLNPSLLCIVCMQVGNGMKERDLTSTW